MIPQRYIHNLPVCNEKEFGIIQKKRVAIVGAGGLGGFITDQLARLGIGELKIIDDDTFELSNLNRQLYSDTLNTGKFKADAAARRAAEVNPDVRIRAVKIHLDRSNARELLNGSDIVFDAVDNRETKLLIQDSCREIGTAFVHGAVGSQAAQISLILPGQDTLNEIYNTGENSPDSRESIPPFIPAIAASLQVAEGLNFLLDRHDKHKRTLIYFNIQDCEMMRMDMGERTDT